MKIPILLLLALVFVAHTSTAQYTFGAGNVNAPSVPAFFLSNPGGSSLIFYRTYFTSGGTDSSSLSVARLGADRVPQVTQSYRYHTLGQHTWTAMAPWPGGGAMAAGNIYKPYGSGPQGLMFLMRLASNGDTLRTIRLDRNLNDQIVGLYVDADKRINAVVRNDTVSGHMGIVRMDSLGRIMSAFRYRFQGLELEPASIAVSTSGALAIAGEVRRNGVASPFLLRLRDTVATGITVFDPGQIPAANTRVTALPDGDWLLTGAMLVNPNYTSVLAIKTDSGGRARWKRCFTGRPFHLTINNPHVLPDGGIMLTGSFSQTRAFSMRLGSQGNLRNAAYYSGPGAFINDLQLEQTPLGLLALLRVRENVGVLPAGETLAGLCQRLDVSVDSMALPLNETYDTVSRLPAAFRQPKVPMLAAPRQYTVGPFPCATAVLKHAPASLPLVLYPNPAGRQFFMEGLEFGKSYTLRLLDAQGRIALSKTVRGGTPVSIEGLPGGMFRVELADEDSRKVGLLLIRGD